MYGPEYGYKTSVSNLMVTHLKSKIQKLRKYRVFNNKSKILDIGSNDGTFFKFFFEKIKKKYFVWCRPICKCIFRKLQPVV